MPPKLGRLVVQRDAKPKRLLWQTERCVDNDEYARRDLGPLGDEGARRGDMLGRAPATPGELAAVAPPLVRLPAALAGGTTLRAP